MIDVGLVISAAAAVITQDVVLWFHLIFVLVIVAALELPFRPFAVRLAVWSIVSTGLVIWAVVDLDTPNEELSELPILTSVLVLVFLVAQSRARTLDSLRRTQLDIERRTSIERETMRTQLEASQRLDVLGRASTRTAHEMKSVLTIVRGCASELGEEASPSIRHKSAEVLDAVDRGLELLDELMAAGRANRHPVGALDLGQALGQIETLLIHLVPEGVELTCVAPPSAVEVDLDRTGFTQIMMNLVSNAVDAVGDRGRIEVSVRETRRHRAGAATPERYAVITVTDSGLGLTDADDVDVFEAGYTTKGDGHSGLGLSMVWQIAARAGGTIEIESNPADGTVVSVLIPLADRARPQRRCVLGMFDERSMAMVSDEFDLLGYEVQRADDIEPARLIDAIAVVEVGHPSNVSIGAQVDRVFHLDDDGPLRPPATPAEATQLVRRILRESATLPL